jgi:hypothetical protein
LRVELTNPADNGLRTMAYIQFSRFCYKLRAWSYVLQVTSFKKATSFKLRAESYELKGIVQRDLTAVETRLKRSVLMNYIVAKFAFLILKEPHHERSIKLVSAS